MISTFRNIMVCSTKIGELPSATTTSTTDDTTGGTLQCSGRGECDNGTCICEIRYSGDECSLLNLPYHASVSSIFYVVALFSLIQLILCIVAEFNRLKQPSLVKACRVTTQKLLYFVVCIAASLRGAYFTISTKQEPFEVNWVSYLMSAYYPLLMTCASLVVCLWAEIFHLRDVRWERSPFLSKSFLGFLAFNLLPYSLFGAEILLSLFSEDRKPYTSFFNGCYAALLLVVVVFFLIYGVEVFFKIRGGFVYDYDNVPSTTRSINASQLHQSRFGLLSQAIMMILVVCFLASETLGDLWKTKVPVQSRNYYDILFRLLEVGMALWFPCCLWNSMAPEQLWILNPRKLLTRQIEPVPSTSRDGERTISLEDEGDTFIARTPKKECWICYDYDKEETLIQPCNCKGDMSSVHPECLRRWLVESCHTAEMLKCKVCDAPYDVERSNKLQWDMGFTIQHWAKTIIIFTIMIITFLVAWFMINIYTKPIVRVVTVGFSVIIEYVCCKFLGENTVSAYKRCKILSVNFKTSHLPTSAASTVVPVMAVPSTSSSTFYTSAITSHASSDSDANNHLDTISEHVLSNKT